MTKQELQEYMNTLARGCEWYNSHPECFKFDYDTFLVEIVGEVSEEAREYVEFCNKRQESEDKKEKILGSMGLRNETISSSSRRIKWGTKIK